MLKIKFQGDGENVFTLLFYFGMDYFTCGTIFVPHVFIHGWIHRVVLGDFNNLFTVRNSAHHINVDVMRVFNCLLEHQCARCLGAHLSHAQRTLDVVRVHGGLLEHC